jgi:hypothetical protein
MQFPFSVVTRYRGGPRQREGKLPSLAVAQVLRVSPEGRTVAQERPGRVRDVALQGAWATRQERGGSR